MRLHVFSRCIDRHGQGEQPMKSYRKELWFDVPSRRAFINITPEIEDCLRRVGSRRAWCSSMPCTLPPRFLSTTMNPDFIRISICGLESLHAPTGLPVSPQRERGQCRCPSEAPDHGREVVVAVTNGELDFGAVGTDLLRRLMGGGGNGF